MTKLRYFALYFPGKKDSIGYPLDYYPEEFESYKHELRKNIIGDCATIEEAYELIHKQFEKEASRRNRKRHIPRASRPP